MLKIDSRNSFYWLAICLLINGPALAETPDKMESKASADHSFVLKTLDGHFPFEVPASPEAWADRAAKLKTRVAMATGMHPMLPRPTVDATIHSPVQRDGFQFEKVFFESVPGHFVTGLLFRPTGDSAANGLNADGKRPGILCPHGHGGRMMRSDAETMAKMIESGNEVHADSGSMAKIARCATLARMGCVVFIFDMVGYADSVQLSYEFAHRRHATRNSEVVSAGEVPKQFFSTAADAQLQSIFGLQTYNALRSFDFLASLPDVDSDRLAVTGGSGGGTQTIMLDALEPRVAVSFPNGMVSTSMQGGCACENACLLRIDTGNVELAALMAPKPMGMTAADDWTKDMMTDGFPELKRLYAMLGRPDDVICEPLLRFPHNYNYVTRRIMYGWMNQHLQLGLTEPIVETDFPSITDAEGAVWNETYPAPTVRGVEHERDVLGWWHEQTELALADSLGRDAQIESFDQNIRAAMATLFDLPLPRFEDVGVEFGESTVRQPDNQEPTTITPGVITDHTRRRQIPIHLLTRDEAHDGEKETTSVVWIDANGQMSDQTAMEDLPDEVSRLLDEHHTVIAIEVASMSVNAADGKQPMNPQPRRASAAFTFGYNRPLAVTRCGDVLAVISAMQDASTAGMTLVASSNSAAYALPAAAIAGPMIDHAIIHADGFRFGGLRHQDDAHFVPGMVKYGDVDALAAWRAPYALTIYDSSSGDSDWPTASAIYAARQAADQLRIK